MIEPLLWTLKTPEQIETAKITELRRAVSAQWQVDLLDPTALWRFSVDEREKFLRTIIDFCGT